MCVLLLRNTHIRNDLFSVEMDIGLAAVKSMHERQFVILYVLLLGPIFCEFTDAS